MKKYFIADALTFGKAIPAVLLVFATIFNWSPLVALVLFAFGELLDALDGMAAVKWPHPGWTKKFWFRRNIKVVESGLDMILGIAALVYTMVRVDFAFGAIVLAVALVIGVMFELIIYGRILGSEKQFKVGSMMHASPNTAKALISARFVVYLIALAGVMLRLFFAAITGTLARIVVLLAAILIAVIILIKKYKDGRLDGVVEMFKNMLQ